MQFNQTNKNAGNVHNVISGGKVTVSVSGATPGPWQVKRQFSNGCETCPAIVSADGKWVAEVVGAPHVVGPEPTMSNANLIAAAPELLAAAKEQLAWYEE